MTDEKNNQNEYKKHLEGILQESQQQIHRLTYYSPITFLPNRQKLIKKFNESLEETADQEKAIILIDIDRFHSINELYGRETGDKILCELAKRLQGFFKEEFSVYHNGEDEFLIRLNKVAYAELERYGQDVLDIFSEPFIIHEKSFFVTASIGMSHYPETGKRVLELLDQAEIAMLSVKNASKNNFRIFDPKDAKRIERKNQLEFDLQKALNNKELFLVYQPKVELETGRLFDVEALIRWEHPELGLISPAEFIPLAEETGQIIEIGEWVLYEAARQTKEWLQQGFEIITCINISAVQFNDANFVDKVSTALEVVQLDSSYLVFELTETVYLNFHYAEVIFKKLQELGIRLALDDFGTGFSSIRGLKESSFDVLKVDKSFIDEVPEDTLSTTLLEGLVNFANELDIEIVAEGVEETEQANFLIDKGYEYGQGFLYSRPVSPEKILEYIQKHGLSSNEF